MPERQQLILENIHMIIRDERRKAPSRRTQLVSRKHQSLRIIRVVRIPGDVYITTSISDE